MPRAIVKYNKFGNKLQDRKIIKCPHCGYEYLPSEIFFDYNTIGRPTKVIRDPLGKILYEEYEEGKEPTSEEIITCEGCENSFSVNMEISYKVGETPEEINFQKETVSLW